MGRMQVKKSVINPRKQKAPLTQQGRVLELLWKKKGGPQNISRSLKKSPSTCNAWKRVTQKVPLKHTRQVSILLKVSPYLLNYVDYRHLEKLPSWETVIKESKLFSDSEMTYIFKGKSPDED